MKQRLKIKNNLPDWLTPKNILELLDDWHSSNLKLSGGQFYLVCKNELANTKCYFTVLEILDQEIYVTIDEIA